MIQRLASIAVLFATCASAHASDEIGNRKALMLAPYDGSGEASMSVQGSEIASIVSALKTNAGFQDADIVIKKDREVNLDYLKAALAGYGIVYWVGHGDYMSGDGQSFISNLYRIVEGKVVLFKDGQSLPANRTIDATGEPYVSSDAMRKKYQDNPELAPLTHGTGPSTLRLGQKFGCTDCGAEATDDDLQSLRVILFGSAESQRYAITPKFVEYYVKNMPNSLVYIATCHSTHSYQLGRAFLGAGAGHFIGFNGYVQSEYAKKIGIDFFNDWTQSGATVSQSWHPNPPNDAYKIQGIIQGGGIYGEILQ